MKKKTRIERVFGRLWNRKQNIKDLLQGKKPTLIEKYFIDSLFEVCLYDDGAYIIIILHLTIIPTVYLSDNWNHLVGSHAGTRENVFTGT